MLNDEMNAEVDAAYQRPPVENKVAKLEIIFSPEGRVVGFTGTARATLWASDMIDQVDTLKDLADSFYQVINVLLTEICQGCPLRDCASCRFDVLKHILEGEDPVIPGTTIATGAPSTCPKCGTDAELGAYRSNAGWYVGTYCGCGPYTRESGYYPTEKGAQEAMRKGGYTR